MYVCMFISRGNLWLLTDAVTLITNTWWLKLQPPQLPVVSPALRCSLCFLHILSLTLFIYNPHIFCFLSSCTVFQSVDGASWLFALIDFFFSSSPSCASQHAWWSQTCVAKTFQCLFRSPIGEFLGPMCVMFLTSYLEGEKTKYTHFFNLTVDLKCCR